MSWREAGKGDRYVAVVLLRKEHITTMVHEVYNELFPVAYYFVNKGAFFCE